MYIYPRQTAIPLETGARCCLLFRLPRWLRTYENILFDVGAACLVASAFSINAKRSVLGRHPMEHFTSSLSKMACVCQKRHVSYSNRASLLPSYDREQDEGNTKITHLLGQLMFRNLLPPIFVQCYYSIFPSTVQFIVRWLTTDKT